jgi:hypothetical protein
VLGGCLLLGNELLDLDVLIAVELGLEPLRSDLFLGSKLLPKLLVLGIGSLLGLDQLFFLVVEELSGVFKLLYLDLEQLQLHVGVFDLLPEVDGLLQAALELHIGLKLHLDLLPLRLEVHDFLVFGPDEVLLKLHLKLEPAV